ncbi:MAG TPA: hypothetical protein VGP16_23285 [Asanoa sp.]|nr:hypothetical protein [Asanoa sp.]
MPLAVVAGVLLITPAPATAAPGPGDVCTITGYSATPGAGADLALQRPEVAPAGMPLHDGATWVIPRGETPVVVIRGGTFGNGWHADIVIAGVARPMSAGGTRTALWAAADSGFGTVTREGGVDLRAGSCVARFTVVADRPMYQTTAGILGGAAVLIGVVGTVLLLRWRRLGIVWRGLLAAPFAMVAGIGQAALLHESGAVSPFDRWTWWLPVGTLALLVVIAVWLGVVQKGRMPAAVPSPAPVAALPPADAAATPATIPPDAEPEPAPVGILANVDPPVAPLPTDLPAPKRPAGVVVPVVTVVVLLAAAFAVAWPRHLAAAAQAETVEPAAARVVFSSVWEEARAGHFDRFEEPAKVFASGVLEGYDGMRTSEITNLEVGVPPDQTGYPAYFVATARSAMGDGRTGFFYALMTRDGPAAPWTMHDFRMSTAESYSVRPKMSGGYLAPLPPITELAFDPATSAQRFADWVTRSAKAGRVVPDEVMALDGIGYEGIVDIATKFAGARGPDVYRAYTITPAQVRPELIPLVDGTVRVSFAVDVRIQVFNNSRPTPRPCATSWLYLNDTDKAHYQTLTLERRRHPAAAVPLKGAKAIVKDNVEREISETGKRC